MSRDVIMTYGEAMVNSIQNGDQPFPVIAQVSLAETAQNAPPTLKDPKNETAKDLWDALERQMRGSKYGEQDRAATLYEYKTFKAIEGELLLDTYLRYLQVINDLKKCGYKKDNYELNYKFLNNLQQEWKQLRHASRFCLVLILLWSDLSRFNHSEGSDADDFSELKKITTFLTKDFNRRKFYSKPTNKNLRISFTSQSANKKQEFVKLNDKKVEKKDDEKKRDISKKDKDEQVLLVEDQAWMESSSDSDQKINTNMVFMAQIEKVLSESETSSSSTDDKISE
nr:hypothetical protein [Tanacetum cinerariifolium]